MKADLADAEAKIDRLAAMQRRALVEQLDTLTEPELQELAEARSIAGVDRTTQTREQMVAVIRAALAD